MKKIFFMAALVVSMMLVVSCASQITTQEEVDNALQKVYDAFRGDLILDGAQSYTVVSGDRLSAISTKYYQNSFYFPLIMLASSDVVLDPDRITPGMKLTVPDLKKNMDNANARAKLKEFLGEIAKVDDRRDRPRDAEGLRALAATL